MNKKMGISISANRLILPNEKQEFINVLPKRIKYEEKIIQLNKILNIPRDNIILPYFMRILIPCLTVDSPLYNQIKNLFKADNIPTKMYDKILPDLYAYLDWTYINISFIILLFKTVKDAIISNKLFILGLLSTDSMYRTLIYSSDYEVEIYKILKLDAKNITKDVLYVPIFRTDSDIFSNVDGGLILLVPNDLLTKDKSILITIFEYEDKIEDILTDEEREKIDYKFTKSQKETLLTAATKSLKNIENRDQIVNLQLINLCSISKIESNLLAIIKIYLGCEYVPDNYFFRIIDILKRVNYINDKKICVIETIFMMATSLMKSKKFISFYYKTSETKYTLFIINDDASDVLEFDASNSRTSYVNPDFRDVIIDDKKIRALYL
jgi:hypothetical protein